ncbi:DUF262 domain-containing protein [Pseudomonas sp. MSSRFD41]|uniref:DUF262 domain-containing protein n=1 Tax=Pseudomonas sp. MSSRFD41 TaxID=1310370 RepID=UPI00163B12B8|nr:DUF262 domain-containing protein [Pseudomonas sp. MSSRFD41]MBC2659696.1 DUF262 domain-containing protein [Pseudomonas sp. MSSRFD41]
MSKFLTTTNRTVVWFKKANDSGDLQMKPPFQRNPVWTLPQKSYLIDSILNGYPVPEIYMQEFVDETGNERHIIIDGQQRTRACLEFVEGRFAIKEDESPTWGGMKFDDLSPDDKKKVFGYTFIVRILPEMSDNDIRGIFQRLNKNVVALNSQELRQATYWGPFIQTMQELSNYSYWNTTGIFTPVNVRRMMDTEYVSELAIAVLHGHQNKKETIDKFYQEYEVEFEHREELISTFQAVIFELEQLLPDIKSTRWKKKTDFYSLFLYLASHVNSLPLSNDTRFQVRNALDEFSSSINSYLSSDTDESDFSQQVNDYGKSIRASSDLGNRRRRHIALSQLIDPILDLSVSQIPLTKIVPLQEGLFDSLDDDN